MNIVMRLLQSVHPPDAAHHADKTTGHSRIAKRSLSGLHVFSLLALGASCLAQAPADVSERSSAAQNTVAIFSDRPMPDGLWQALSATLRQDLTSNAPEVRSLTAQIAGQSTNPAAVAGSTIEILRGDTIKPGIQVDNSITVYLAGDCKTTATPRPSFFGEPQPRVSGALGWVNMNNGHIAPFIHVDCRRIGQMLGLAGSGRSRDQQNRLMANAISRVVLHEWIHIATQNPSHSRQGVTKAQFGVQDLLAQPPQPVLLQGTGWVFLDQESGIRLVQSPPPNQPSQARPWGTK